MPEKLGIFGGTFNPVHNGHMRIAALAYEAFKLDRILMIPSGISYFKAGQYIPDGKVRYEMCRLAASGHGFIEVSDIEIKREGNSYTYETLRELKKSFGDADFYYILGADSLFELRTFKNPEEILKSCHLLVSARDDYDSKALRALVKSYEKDFDAVISVFNASNIDISSNMIRNMVKNGEDISDLVPPLVSEFINEKKLYR